MRVRLDVNQSLPGFAADVDQGSEGIRADHGLQCRIGQMSPLQLRKFGANLGAVVAPPVIRVIGGREQSSNHAAGLESNLTDQLEVLSRRISRAHAAESAAVSESFRLEERHPAVGQSSGWYRVVEANGQADTGNLAGGAPEDVEPANGADLGAIQPERHDDQGDADWTGRCRQSPKFGYAIACQGDNAHTQDENRCCTEGDPKPVPLHGSPRYGTDR